MYYVYILKNKVGEIYTGVTSDIEKRIQIHNLGRGAKYTKKKFPFYLAFQEAHSTLTSARRREKQIKGWRRDKKEFLVEQYKLTT